jgi:hypothetical protein
MAANLQHPNIITIHEVGQHDGPHHFSMDFVEGRTWAEMVREHPLPPAHGNLRSPRQRRGHRLRWH